MQAPLNPAFAIDVVEKPDPADRKEQRGSQKYKQPEQVAQNQKGSVVSGLRQALEIAQTLLGRSGQALPIK